MNKRHYEHTLPNIRGSLSNTYAETDGVSEHRRIEFGISPAFVSFFFTHITLDLAV